MTKLIDLYKLAEERNIPVDLFELRKREALSFLECDGSCFIAIDPNRITNELDEKLKLAHELGHCETGSFYNCWAAHDLIEKHELRAERWTIKKFLPKEELYAAIADKRDQWEISEIFEVPITLVHEAIAYYKQIEHDKNPDIAETVQTG